MLRQTENKQTGWILYELLERTKVAGPIKIWKSIYFRYSRIMVTAREPQMDRAHHLNYSWPNLRCPRSTFLPLLTRSHRSFLLPCHIFNNWFMEIGFIFGSKLTWFFSVWPILLGLKSHTCRHLNSYLKSKPPAFRHITGESMKCDETGECSKWENMFDFNVGFYDLPASCRLEVTKFMLSWGKRTHTHTLTTVARNSSHQILFRHNR